MKIILLKIALVLSILLLFWGIGDLLTANTKYIEPSLQIESIKTLTDTVNFNGLTDSIKNHPSSYGPTTKKLWGYLK